MAEMPDLRVLANLGPLINARRLVGKVLRHARHTLAASTLRRFHRASHARPAVPNRKTERMRVHQSDASSSGCDAIACQYTRSIESRVAGRIRNAMASYWR